MLKKGMFYCKVLSLNSHYKQILVNHRTIYFRSWKTKVNPQNECIQNIKWILNVFGMSILYLLNWPKKKKNSIEWEVRFRSKCSIFCFFPFFFLSISHPQFFLFLLWFKQHVQLTLSQFSLVTLTKVLCYSLSSWKWFSNINWKLFQSLQKL